MKECKIIAVTSSKGGAGKTTLTAILSTTIFNVYGGKIAVLDIDPNRNLEKMRLQETNQAKNGDTTLVKQLFKNKEKYGRMHTDLYTLDMTKEYKIIEQNLEKLKAKYDYIFIDLPGSSLIHRNGLRILKKIDWIFLPLYVSKNDYDTTIEFYEGIKKLNESNSTSTEIRIFFNKYSTVKNKANFEAVKEYLNNTKRKVLNNIVKDQVQVERYSTILSPKYTGHKNDIHNWVDEVYELIKL